METNRGILIRCLRMAIEIEALINTHSDSAILHDAGMRLRFAVKEINHRMLSVKNQMSQYEHVDLLGTSTQM